MYDQRLVKMLLEPLQPMVVLVGEPVFRLSGELNRVVNCPDYTVDVPVVYKTKSVELYIAESRAAERDYANCVMCLHLPAGLADPESLLGLASRASPNLLLIEHTGHDSDDNLLADDQFFAFGFRVLEKSLISGRQTALYAYSLSSYKQAPDWLNNRYWAHPERFDASE